MASEEEVPPQTPEAILDTGGVHIVTWPHHRDSGRKRKAEEEEKRKAELEEEIRQEETRRKAEEEKRRARIEAAKQQKKEAEESRIEDIRSVCCRNNYNAFHSVKSIHFHKQLVESLFTLIIPSSHSSTSTPTYGIYFVYEYYARSVLSSLLKHVSHSTGTNTNKHFHEV